MKRLSREKRALIVRCFTEGVGVNAAARMADVSKNTVLKLLADLGPICREYQSRTLVHLNCGKIQVDEIWSFTGMKAKNVPEELAGTWGVGDTWVWVAICAECRLAVSWLVGPRDGFAARLFMRDVASRLDRRVQLTSDGHRPCLEAVESAFGADVDYAMLVKLYGEPDGTTPTEKRYSPGQCCGTRTDVICGEPDPRHVSTSYSERLNLEIRTKNRRLTHLTNGYSRKVANLEHSMDVGFMVYNFVKRHGTLQVSPAMEAGVTDHLWAYEEVVGLLEAAEPSAVEVGGRRKDRRSN